MVNGAILDSWITASSEYRVGLAATMARLRVSSDSWTAANNDPPNEWIQVNLQQQTLVSGVITQGRPNFDQWVTDYTVEHSDDGIVWIDVDNGMVCKCTYRGMIRYL